MKGRNIPYSAVEMRWLEANRLMVISDYHKAFVAGFRGDTDESDALSDINNLTIKALSQPEAGEPVAWQFQTRDGKWVHCEDAPDDPYDHNKMGWRFRPLYTRPTPSADVRMREALVNGAHYAGAILKRLEQLYNEHENDPRLREHIGDEVSWLEELRSALTPAREETQSEGANKNQSSDGGVEGHAIPQTTSATPTRYPATEGEENMGATARRTEADASTKTGQADIKLGPSDPTPEVREDVPPFADTGYGSQMLREATTYLNEYVFDCDNGADHVPTEFERFMLEDFTNGLISHEPFFGIIRGIAGRLRSLVREYDAFTAAPAPVDVEARRWRHKRRGSTYIEIGRGNVQCSAAGLFDMHSVVIYRSEKDGSLWARPVKEFEDGRFEALNGPGLETRGE